MEHDHKSIEVESELQFQHQNLYRSCCLQMDKRFVLLIMQITITLIIVIFSIFKLVLTADCPTTNVYIALISTALGYWLPRPSLI